jgi:hypothetical protein
LLENFSNFSSAEEISDLSSEDSHQDQTSSAHALFFGQLLALNLAKKSEERNFIDAGKR